MMRHVVHAQVSASASRLLHKYEVAETNGFQDDDAIFQRMYCRASEVHRRVLPRGLLLHGVVRVGTGTLADRQPEDGTRSVAASIPGRARVRDESPITPRAHDGGAPALDVVFVVGPYDPLAYTEKAVFKWLNTLAQGDTIVGGIDTGSHLLGRAGLLKGKRCTIHWENMQGFVTEFPDLQASYEIYENDNRLLTCAGGTAPMDMVLYMIEKQQGFELAASVSEVLIHPNIRQSDHPQRMSVEARTGVRHAALLECIELMEANLEQPLTPVELSGMIHISKRQLERLFKRHLNTTPARYYLTLRLTEARRLLEQTSLPIIDVAMACGFNSAGHFSYRYRSFFGVSPRATRSRMDTPADSRQAAGMT